MASKKRFRRDISNHAGQELDDYFILEEDYNPSDLISGFNVYCETFIMSDTSEFELAIRKLTPSLIILYEP